MPNVRQNADGSESLLNAANQSVSHLGGAMGVAGSNTPDFVDSVTARFNLAGGTDTAGGILAWQNPFSYDVMVTGAQLRVTTIATAACTVSIGSTAVSAVTSASNIISGQDVNAATGVFAPAAPIGVVVASGKWVTASKASGASAGLVATLALQLSRAS